MRSLLDLPTLEARAMLAKGTPVFLPVNPVEYHGPHLSLYTDALICAGFIRDLHARLAEDHPDWSLLAVDDLHVGVDPVPGPGTRAVAYATVCELVTAACRALADLGAQRVVLMASHLVPQHSQALEEGVTLLRARGVRAVAPFNLVPPLLINGDPDWLATLMLGPCHPDLEEARAGLAADIHAGAIETSLALHYAPGSVHPRFADLPPCPAVRRDPALHAVARAAKVLGRPALARELDFAAVASGWYALRPFPGYSGVPHLASARAGKKLAKLCVNEMLPSVKRVLDGEGTSPSPFMRWVWPATLGGRVLQLRVPPEAVQPPQLC
jgi:creatinine amidohydrolase